MMFENIEELLKNAYCHVVNSNGQRWLFWDKDIETWTVMEHKRYAKKTRVIYQGDGLREAMQLMK